jgi:hypothetical protein
MSKLAAEAAEAAEADEKMANYIKSKGHFPLQRLTEHYGIEFNEWEKELVDVNHSLFWSITDKILGTPPSPFLGTPLELWLMIMRVDYRYKNENCANILGPRSGGRGPIIMVPDDFLQDPAERIFLRWSDGYKQLQASLMKKIGREKTPFDVHYFQSITRNMYSRDDLNVPAAFMRDTIVADYGKFHYNNNIVYADLEEEELSVIQLCYSQIIFEQVLLNKWLPSPSTIMPMSRESTPMEVWLIIYDLYDKRSIGWREICTMPCTAYISGLKIFYYMYMGQEDMTDEINSQSFHEILRNIILKLCSENRDSYYTELQKRRWAFTLGLSRADRNTSMIRGLSGDNVDHIISSFMR